MKKISKVELKNATVLNESEMRNVVGGSGVSGNENASCPIVCHGISGAIMANTCRGAAYKCGNAGIDHCSGHLDECFPGLSYSSESEYFKAVEEYYYK